jgi:hypothetical protein
MKKIIIITILFILLISVSCYAVTLTETILCKKVFLNLVKRVVLVHRITGKVEYILTQDGKWAPLEGPIQSQYQSMYNAQITPR